MATVPGKAGTEAIPTGVTLKGDKEDQVHAWLNPLRLAVARNATGVPQWLVAAMTVDGVNNVKEIVPALGETPSYAGLYRLRLAPTGMPQPGAQWQQIAGPAFPESFPVTWRFVTGLVATGKGVVACTQAMAATKPGTTRWYEGAVLVCDDVGAASPIFRLALCHPAARGVAVAGQRVFVALGEYSPRIADFSVSTGVCAWHPATDWPLPGSANKAFNASYAYFKVIAGTKLTTPCGPIGVYEVLGPGKQPLLSTTAKLPTRAELEAMVDPTKADALDSLFK